MLFIAEISVAVVTFILGGLAFFFGGIFAYVYLAVDIGLIGTIFGLMYKFSLEF